MRKLFFTVVLVASFSSLGQEIDRMNNRYLIKLTPTQMTVGEINLGFEYRVANHSSLELTLGPTISNLGSQTSQVDYDIVPPGYLNQYTIQKSALGFFGALEYRFYPLSYANAPRGLYLAPSVKYRVYNTEVSDNAHILPDTKNEKTEFMFRLNFGYQFWLSDKFALDVFSGIGLMVDQRTSNYINVEYDEFGMPIEQTNWTSSTNSNPRITATMGVKVGIGR